MGEIARRLERARARVAAACARSFRSPGSVTLLAVSKTRTAAEIREAFEAGQEHFGENRVQEAAGKAKEGLPPGVQLELVGRLQSNKARAAAALFCRIHSVDSESLLKRLDSAAPGPLEVFLELKLADEPTKGGAAPEALGELLAVASGLARVRVQGLMCVPPAVATSEEARPYFRRLRELRDAHGGAARLPHLSMGMSHDFEVAIEEGATVVRLGELIFGPRRVAP